MSCKKGINSIWWADYSFGWFSRWVSLKRKQTCRFKPNWKFIWDISQTFIPNRIRGKTKIVKIHFVDLVLFKKQNIELRLDPIRHQDKFRKTQRPPWYWHLCWNLIWKSFCEQWIIWEDYKSLIDFRWNIW